MSLFRKQAVRQYADPDARGGLLRVTPPTGLRVFAVLVGIFVVLAVLAVTQRVNVTARGRGVVRPPEGVFVVHAPLAGRVQKVVAEPGTQVGEGDPLVELGPRVPLSGADLAALEALAGSWETRAAGLTGESDAPVAAAWRSAIEELAAATRQVAEGNAPSVWVVRAPRAGLVDALALREGEQVAAGQPVAKVVPRADEVVALLAVGAEHRAELEVGRAVRLSLDEHPAEEAGFATAKIARISADPLSREVTDPLLAELLDDRGPHYLVELEPTAMPPRAEGRFTNGMIFTGEVVLRQERIISLLFPPLAALLP